MKASWENAPLKRPDRYLDWKFRNRQIQQDHVPELWCSIYIEVRTDTDEDGVYIKNLKRLRKEVKDTRRQDNDDVLEGTITIRMIDEELRLLDRLIEQIENRKGPKIVDPVTVRFFIYRPEKLIYSNGEFNDEKSAYSIILAGPPIEGLTLNHDFGRSIIGDPPSTFKIPVAIGIIDDGIAFANERFRTASGGSRIEAIWLQDLEYSRADNGVAFGERLNKKNIDKLLQEHKNDAGIYRSKGLLDFGNEKHKSLALRVSHGTHVMDLAAGFDPAENEQFRPVFAVQLPVEATADTSGVTMGSYVLQGFRQIMLWADERDPRMPLVINFSYGILAGPKDGTHHIEKIIGQLVDHRNNRSKNPAPTHVVLPAGNSYRTRATARMKFSGKKSEKTQALDWMILPDDRTPSFLEIWFEEGAYDEDYSPVELTLAPPSGVQAISDMPSAGKMKILKNTDRRPVAGIYYDLVPTDDGKVRPRIFIAINQTSSRAGDENVAPAGRWQLSLKNKTREKLKAKFYIQRDDTLTGYPQKGRQSYFEHSNAYGRDSKTGEYKLLMKDGPITHEATLSAIANGNGTIVVGAAEGSEHFPPSNYTSSGRTETRDGPDLSAIADDGTAFPGVLAAGTYSGTVVAINGTSMAAPQVARRLANLIAGGKDRNALCSGNIQTFLNPRRQGNCVLMKDNLPHIPRRKYPSIP